MRSAIARTPAAAAATALILAGAVSLAACEREAAPVATPAAPPPSEQPLAGAPEGPPPPSPEMTAEGPPPPPSDQPAPPPAMDAPSAAEPGIVAMAPIPNPPETPRRSYRPASAHHRHGHAHHRYASARRVHYRYASAAAHPRTAAPAMRPSAHAAPAMAAPHAAQPSAHPGTSTVAPAVATHHAKAAARHHGATGPHANGAASPRADRVAALQTALGGAMAGSAKLDTPRFTVGTPADVSLTVPASFAETLRTEAGRQGLADDAASVALIARLAGDGYVVIPDTVQRQMLAAGQPSVFHWTVTQQQGARGPLQAGVGAQLMGGGGQDQLDLGVVKAAQASGAGWKMFGAIILLLVVAAIVALLARAGGGGGKASDRRRRYANEVRTARPFDMNGAPPLDRRDDLPPRV